MKASLLYPSQCYLGEGPLWHAERRSCFWVDIENGMLYEHHWHDASVNTWQFNYKVTMVVQGKNNDLLISLDTAIAKFDPASAQLTWLFDIEKENDNRCNDAACDSRGRLWVGTMHLKHLAGEGSLYCCNGKEVDKKVSATSISNGIAWSLDNTRLYFIDSPTQVVQSFIYDEYSGAIDFEKNAIEIPGNMGTPDGMAIDEEGMLWVAHWGGYGVYRWDPFSGKHLSTIEVPAPHVTSCAFAGENLDHLVITTARENLTAEQQDKYPQSGDVFVVTPGVKGVKAFKCIL